MEKKKYLFRELVVDSRTGLNPRKNFKLGHGDNYYITIKDIHDGEVVITDKTERIDDNAMKIINKRSRLKVGDVLFSSIGRIGETAIIKEEPKNWNINESVFAFTVNKDLITPEFFRWMFKAPRYKNEIQRESTGSTFVSIKMNKLNDMEFEIPLVKQQELIVEELTNLEKLIILSEEELQLTNELIKSKYYEMFLNYEKRFLHQMAVITMGQSPDSKSYNNAGDGMPFFQGKGDYGAKYTIVRHWTTLPTKTVKKGTVLMSVRAPVGPVNMANVDCCIGRGLCGINAIDGKSNNEFLFNALKTIEDEIALMGNGSTFKAISKEDVYKIMVPDAPIDLQNAFSDYSKQISGIQNVILKKKQNLEEILNSKIDYYFGI